DVTELIVAEMRERLESLSKELEPVGQLMLRSASVQARLEGVGVVSKQACFDLGLVGVAARAGEVPRDGRPDHPYGAFRFAHMPVGTGWAGDVLARTLVRWLEVRRSLEFVLDQVVSLPKGAVQVECGAPRPSEIVVALEEGWRGEIAHVVVTDEHGGIR